MIYFSIGIVPQGGNTGLVGGAVPYPQRSPFHSAVILSLSKMNRIESIDGISGVVKVESGCILEQVDAQCRREAKLMVPLDLGAKGSCQIGGILSTNAGGIRFLRYCAHFYICVVYNDFLLKATDLCMEAAWDWK